MRFLSWEFEKKCLSRSPAVKKNKNPSIVPEVMDNSCLHLSLLLREDRAAHHCELYIKYMMNAGGMKDNVFQMSSTKANMINVIDCAIIAVELLQ